MFKTFFFFEAKMELFQVPMQNKENAICENLFSYEMYLSTNFGTAIMF